MVAGFNAALDVGRRFSFQSFNRQLEDLIRNEFFKKCFLFSESRHFLKRLACFEAIGTKKG